MSTISERFNQFEYEFLRFDKITHKYSNRPDVHAFILLDQLIPGNRNLICASEHDEIFLDISMEDLEKSNITDKQICELVRCGIREGDFGLCMFT